MNQIARRIIYERYRRNYCINNYTPPGWFECDVFELTAAGFFREYEIKASRGDFFADKNKSKGGGEWTEGTGWVAKPNEFKHAKLARNDINGPSRFFFVTPKEMISREELPPWAGLMEWELNDGHFPWNVVINTIVEAPLIHRCKFSPERQRRLLETCYWRYHGATLHRTTDESKQVAVA